jgi:glycosyltransferase involved in cell wall biosynthesis
LTPPDVLLDVRVTSHMSAGMRAYVQALRRLLPVVAPDLGVAEFGSGDNFDVAEQVAMPLRAARLRPRLVHFPTPFVPRVVPAPHVVTVHDVIDLEFPQYAKRKVGPYWRRVVGPVLRSARAVITDDEATVALLERYLGVDASRVAVIPLGADVPDPLPAPMARARPYFFYAGNHRPHKDLATLVAAWASLPDRDAVDLVLTGDEEPGLRLARHARAELVFTGECSADEMWRWYRGAVAYVHPALREGFGLPLLEALRAGTPVIAADRAVPAVLAPHVHRYAAHDVVALRALLLRAAEQPEAFGEGSERARAATTHLTWEGTVRSTAELYRRLLTVPRAGRG